MAIEVNRDQIIYDLAIILLAFNLRKGKNCYGN